MNQIKMNSHTKWSYTLIITDTNWGMWLHFILNALFMYVNASCQCS